MTYDEIIKKVSEDTGYPAKFVDRVYKCYWRAIRDYIKSLPLKEDLTDEEFNKLKPNVNIPSIGKLNVTLERYRNMKKHMEMLEERKRRYDSKTEESD